MVKFAHGSFWVYAPTKHVSIVFAILFGISLVLHIWQNNLKYKSWRIGFLLPWAALLFVAGFALREYGAYNYDNLSIYISSQVLLFLAPPVYNGANYFIFGRLLYYVPYLSPLHPGRVWTTFVALDMVDGIIAGNGASYAANRKNTESKIRFGVVLVKASLFLLLGMFLAFISLVIIFHRRCRAAHVFNYKIKVIIYELYFSCFLILIRNVFRTASFFYSPISPVNGDEVYFWVLEILPMLVNTYLLNLFPPAKYLPWDNKIYLAQDGKTELKGPGMVDNRPFLLSFFDPFDLVGLLRGEDHKSRFWEHDGIGGPAPPNEVNQVDNTEAEAANMAGKTGV
ncbi:Lipid-translocating exporter-like protein RTA1 [Exophiala dermatitidis]